jgi:amidase
VTELHFASASQLARAIARREIGCLEALEMYIGRVERHASLNAVVVRDYDRARRRAQALDTKRESPGPLHGVPITVKESFDVAGLPTTYGLPEFARNIPGRSAVAVQRLEAAGAVVFGKTNVPRVLLDWQSFNAVYGRTNNPWDASKTPGGSSGGSAAALAAGLTALEIGSDIGGSIRVPAHMCGVFGHKPTYGLLPMTGHSLTGTVSAVDIAVIGPLARSVDDLVLCLDLLAHPDPSDSRAHIALPPARTETPAGMRIAVWTDDPVSPTDPQITAQIAGLAAYLARRGAEVTFTRPAIDAAESYELFLKLIAAAISARFSPDELEAAKERVAANPADTGPDAILDRHFGLLHREWLALNERRHQIRRIWQHFFDDFDVLICPPFAMPALPHDTLTPQRERRLVVAGRTWPYNGLGFWAGIVGAYFLPATVVPLGVTSEKLPIGAQIVGPMYGDRQTLALAGILERDWRGFVAPPLA